MCVINNNLWRKLIFLLVMSWCTCTQGIHHYLLDFCRFLLPLFVTISPDYGGTSWDGSRAISRGLKESKNIHVEKIYVPNQKNLIGSFFVAKPRSWSNWRFDDLQSEFLCDARSCAKIDLPSVKPQNFLLELLQYSLWFSLSLVVGDLLILLKPSPF